MCLRDRIGCVASLLALALVSPLPQRDRLARKHAFHALIRPLGVSLALALAFAPPLTPQAHPRKLCCSAAQAARGTREKEAEAKYLMVIAGWNRKIVKNRREYDSKIVLNTHCCD
jgi:hypothetical protein